MRFDVALYAARQAFRMHLPTAAACALAASAALGAYVHTVALGMSAQAAFDTVSTLHWLILSALAIALGTHIAALDATAPLLIARGRSAGRLWLQHLLGATAVLLLTSAVSGIILCATPWAVLGTQLAVCCGITAQALVVLTLAALLRRFLPPSWTWFVAISLWWVGHMADETLALAAESRSWAAWVYRVLPDLDRLNGATWAWDTPTPVALALVSTGLWCAAFIGGALWTLRR